MELQTYLDHVNQGKRLEGGSEVHAFMTQAARRAQQITAEINTGYHDGEELRALFSQLIGKPVDEGFGLFPPFTTDFGKNITLGKRVFINSGCRFQDQGGITIGDDVLLGHNVVLATFAAYALSRFRFKGKAFYTCVIFITQVLPQVVIVVPVFMMLQKLGLYNTYAGVIITILATSMAFPILLMRSFFDSVPYALEEAAAIDGCGPVKTFWLIMFPLARPAVMTVTIFNFIAKWNEYFMALIFVNKSELRPVGVGLYATVQSMVVTGDWAGMFASVVIVFLPTVIIYLFLSRQIVAGVTAGGIKG